MSTRAGLSIALLVVAALWLGYYVGREQPATAVPAAATATATPATTPEVTRAPEVTPAPEVKPAPAPAEVPTPATVVERPPTTLDDILVRQAELHRSGRRLEAIRITVIGGEEISLHFQEVIHPRRSLKEIDDGQSGGFFQPLAAAARAGDDVAARALYESLRSCRGWPKTRADLEVRQAERAKWFAQTGGVVMPGHPPIDFDKDREDSERRFRRCEGVTEDMYPTALELLRESAERGLSDDNRAAYAQTIAHTDPNEARAQYEILWQLGYLEALKWLGRDSLPHALAFAATLQAVGGAPEVAEQLKAAEAAVSPLAFAEASKEAAQILKNPNCCKF